MDQLEGTVERITYFNPENGYSVVRLKPVRPGSLETGIPGSRDGLDLVTLVGNLPELTPGEHVRLLGQWISHADYGQQFRVERCEQTLPATVEGIRRYLGSGLIKGVGPKTAERIVQAFGAGTLEIIDTQPQRLREVPDIGPKRYRLICEAWVTQKHIKEVMVFLQGHGISTGLAVKIYKQYGDDSVNVVQTDPYQLARDIWGIGFRTADKIARALGLPPDAPSRLEAGLAHVLSEMADDGHVFSPEPDLLRAASELLALPAEPLPAEGAGALPAEGAGALPAEGAGALPAEGAGALPAEGAGALPAALDHLLAARRVARETLPDLPAPAVYLMPFYQAEVHVAERLQALLSAPVSRLAGLARLDWAAELARAGGAERSVELSAEQRQAVQLALTHKVCVLTGGPGTGKTTTLRALIRVLERRQHPVALASPTGRAAKRLAEATGRPAQTLHRLLGFSPTGGFQHNEHQRLPAHMIVVDEVSMLDLILTNNLLKAADPAAHLLFVGDVDQLPSVGAGNVLRDLVASGQVPVIRLGTIFRQAAGSHIITNAHRINSGQPPVFDRESNDFFLFPEDNPESAAQRVVEVVSERIPRRFGMDPLNDVQVLAPMHRGAAGVSNLNLLLQAALNPPAPSKSERLLAGRTFRAGDRVMQIRNNYQKGAFNGDIGRLEVVDAENQTLTAVFDGRPVVYEWSEADELVHAFAVSIHKAQGSEFPAVVVPMLTQHYVMLQRNLLYTAITRARKLCVLVGTRKAIAIAVGNAQVARRWSGLAARLRAAAPVGAILG